MTNLPCFDEDTHARTHQDHPARVLVVIDEIEEHHNLHENIGDNLEDEKISKEHIDLCRFLY